MSRYTAQRLQPLHHSPNRLDVASTSTKDSAFIFTFKGNPNPSSFSFERFRTTLKESGSSKTAELETALVPRSQARGESWLTGLLSG